MQNSLSKNADMPIDSNNLPNDKHNSSSESDVMTREEGKAMLEEMDSRSRKAVDEYYRKYPERLKRIVPKGKQT